MKQLGRLHHQSEMHKVLIIKPEPFQYVLPQLYREFYLQIKISSFLVSLPTKSSVAGKNKQKCQVIADSLEDERDNY